jgi:phenylalanyl-tRNA synthetase alpha chain
MTHLLEELRAAALAEIAVVSDEQALDAVRVHYLGRSGSISAWGEQMKTLSKEERPVVGKLLNEVRNAVTVAIEQTGEKLRVTQEAGALAGIDISLPGTPNEIGALHPLTQILDRAIGIFRRMGFALAEGPDVEDEWHCFDALNTAPDHPARNEQDTFYLPDGRLLRTHTSTVQIRAMESAPPPVRVIAPGAAFRRDEVDATHSAQFHQIEGLYVDERVSVADLKGTLEFFLHELFGADTAVRFRPHYFPFTEPSFEIDVKSKALKSGEKWIEVCGCGMVHPSVFEEVNRARGDAAYDPEKWTGFAFGLAQNDLRFLRQFA